MDLENKICACCGFKNKVLTDDSKKLILERQNRPMSEGARGYFDLWHIVPETCLKCGYTSLDISKVDEKIKAYVLSEPEFDIFESEEYENVSQFRSNNAKTYYKCGAIAEKNNDLKLSAICDLLTGNEIYKEMMFWANEMTEENGKLSSEDLLDKVKIEKFADKFYDSGIEKLKKYISKNKDFDYVLLLYGVMTNGNKDQVKEAEMLYEKITTFKLNTKQQTIFDFINRVKN